jgi:hypothetical protein
MRWFAATLALLGASVGLVAGIYLRDRSTNWLPPQRTVAHSDALAVAAHIGGTCPRDCTVKLLGHPRTDHWLERVEIPTATQCFDIDVRTFATQDVHGLSGVTRIACNGISAAGPD